MKITETSLPGVFLVQPKIFSDSRGAFWETYNEKAFAEAGLPTSWVQDNCSFSIRNVVRGLHYQVVQPQAKLVRASLGTILDVAVDIRRSSPHFGRHVAVELSAENGAMLYIPTGFAHGFIALSEKVGLAYKVTDFYCPQGERTLLWNDQELAISWPVSSDAAILSAKDAEGALLQNAEVFA